MFFCAISGEAPSDPVVSNKSGHVYERRLILKYVSENGTDPVTGEKLEESDLVSIKASPNTAPPRLPTQSSIPVLLHTLQNEWDALVLEMFALKQQYNSTRQELSYALYAQDAATRVIARLIKERDAAREALSNVQATMESTSPVEDAAMAEDDQAGERLPKAIVAQIEETCDALSSARKKRKLPKGHASPADVKAYVPIHTIPSLHSASPAGITSLAVSRITPSQFLTGGNDKVVQLYDKSTDKVLFSLKGHTKRVNHVALRERDGEPTLLLSAGADKIAKIWSRDAVTGDHELKATIKVHKGELTGLAVHPISTIVSYASLDKTFSLHDLTTTASIFRSQPSDDPYSCLSIHPDGALLGLGTPASTVQIYDVRTGLIAASLAPSEAPPFVVHSMSFSENGYYLLAPHSSSSIATWDLRKQQPVNVLSLGDSFKLKKVLYDTGGFFFGAVGKEGLRVFAYKTYEELRKFDDAGELSDLAFGPLGKEIWAAGGREVRIWGPSA